MQWHNTSLKQVTATRIAAQLLISTVPTCTLPQSRSRLTGDECGCVFVSSICSSSPTVGWGRGGGWENARRADGPIFQMHGAAPVGCSLDLYTVHFPLALQDSGRGGGGYTRDQILFSPPIVCVQ